MLNGRIDVKKIQTNVTDKSKNVWFAGLGVYSVVTDEGSKFYHKMIDTSKDFVEKGKKLDKANKKKTKADAPIFAFDKVVDTVKGKVKNVRDIVIEPLGVSSHNEVKELNEKVDKLTEIVVVLAQKLDNKKVAVKAAA